MKLTTIDIQGNIFTSEILEKIRLGDIRFQKPQDFDLNPSESIRDEISNAWSLLNTHWQIFKQKRELLMPTDTGTTETRNYWLQPFFSILGYEFSLSRTETINNKSYAISHRVTNKDEFPIHTIGCVQSLDKRAEHGVRLSPHALMQEYLNYTEHLYGIITNGLRMRILRDATRLTRLNYIEFDLEKMMEEGQYAEFAIIYRLLHVSRLSDKKEENENSIIEYYHNEALASGSRIRERLSEAVEHSIISLTNGLIQQNIDLSESLKAQELTAKDYYLHILRSVYRILFLLVIEERQLIYKSDLSEEERKKQKIYYQFYSIQRLTNLVDKAIYIDRKKTDLWASLLTTFKLFEDKEFGDKLGIDSLSSGIFHPYSIRSLHNTTLDNATVLKVFQNLVTFKNDNNQTIRVNYADLDVEEFGSVYEGLLEYEPVVENNNFYFKEGSERSSSGSHYTPEELVKPLIEHSLEYVIKDKLKEPNPEDALLSITVCDVACGSGHILLSAARRIGFELAKLRSQEDQPTPTVLRVAIRDVIRNCIYGVDLNPLAVELCKVALWLEAHEPGEPLNFLDHHIKNGNAIVGLAHYEELQNGIADDAFKTLPNDDKDFAKTLRDKNKKERKSKQLRMYDTTQVDLSLTDIQHQFRGFSKLPEHTPEQIEKKAKVYQDLTSGPKWFRLKQLADLQVAQFFIPKILDNKEKITTQEKYHTYLNTGVQIHDRGASMALSEEKKFFHWFLEFPEVFQNGGFDCILGNPPFLGDRRIKAAYGEEFLNWIRTKYTEGSTTDLVVYFFLRNFDLVNKDRFISLISTNTIAQGKSREQGLERLQNIGTINHAVKSMPWPGLAAVEVSLVTIYKGKWEKELILNGKKTQTISAFLDDGESNKTANQLKRNEGKSYQGVIVLGTGFVLEKEEAEQLLKSNPSYTKVIQPYLNGNDLNNNPDQSPSRYVINFYDWEEEYCRTNYPAPYHIIEERVKPERTRWKKDKEGNDIIGKYALRGSLPKRWWQFAEKRPALQDELKELEYAMVSCRVSKYVNQSLIKTDMIFDVATSVVTRSSYYEYAFLQNTFHKEWAWKYASTLESRIRYVNGDCIDTFPILKIEELSDKGLQESIENIGNSYHEFRKELMLKLQLGLTKTYNAFHALEIKEYPNMKDKQVDYLYKHLAKTPDTIEFENAILGIIQLRDLHVELDNIILNAYGWSDIDLRHDFYEVDYLPENDNIRFTIHTDARKEVLKRLLELNHKMYEEEIASDLGDEKKTTNKKKVEKKSSSTSKDNEYQSPELFESPNLFNLTASVSNDCRVIVKQVFSNDVKNIHITPKAVEGGFTGGFQQVKEDSEWKALIGKKVGDKAEVDGEVWEVLEVV